MYLCRNSDVDIDMCLPVLGFQADIMGASFSNEGVGKDEAVTAKCGGWLDSSILDFKNT